MEARPPETVVSNEATTVDPLHVAAFNEWMRRYTDQPERFTREWQSVGAYLKEVGEGKEPTYGERCAALFAMLMAENENRQ